MTGKYQMKRTTFLIELSIRKNATFVSGILIKYPDHFHKNFSMINFDKFTLSNGLRVIVHHDPTTPLVAMNILYDVGARDEDPDKTGFAHLFEHLMFGGSINIPSYDEPLQKAGGENNAFTNCDFTNYYLTLPKNNLETAFWLESDRMLDLAFSEKSLEVQRQVVIEEFNQSYLNQPYGDVWLLLKPLAYKVHPYQWNTIGKTTQHIAEATMADVKSFYSRYYNPNNAILSLAGDIQSDEIRVLAEKWFGPIASGPENTRKLPAEPDQKEARTLTVHRDVPTNAIYKAWHSCSRMDKNYIASDLISDILGSGESSVLKKELVKKKRLFSEIDAYITGDIDPGLFIISGKLMPDVSIGENAILYPGVKIYHECIIGNNCTLHSGVIIGSDGFGFAPVAGNNYQKIPQLGNVILEDYVEIGSNTTIDRATLGSTIIRKGVKLDNLIQVGHNAEIGENTVIAAQTGISGSTRIGKNCMIGGQVGIVGHITIADDVKIGAGSGIEASITEEGSIVLGSPAIPIAKARRNFIHWRNFDEIVRKILAGTDTGSIKDWGPYSPF